MVFVAAGWNRLCLALCLTTEWKSKAPRKKLEADTAIANTRAPPSTATNKRFPTSSAYAISDVGIISFPFSVACTQCR